MKKICMIFCTTSLFFAGFVTIASAASVQFDFSGTNWVHTLGLPHPGNAYVTFNGFVEIDDSRLGTAVLGQYFTDWSITVTLTSYNTELGGGGGAEYIEMFNPSNAKISLLATSKGGAVLDLTGAKPELQMLAFDSARTTFTGAEVNNWRFTYDYMMLKTSGQLTPTFTGQDFRGNLLISEASAVPVPSALILLGSGLVSLVGLRRKK